MAEHPTPAELLIAREEPTNPDSRRILEHVATCAACQKLAEGLESTERHIAEYVAAASERLPDAPSVERIRSRLRTETVRRPLALPARRNLALAAGLAACVVLALYLRNPIKPESVEAAEVLRHATEYVRTADRSSSPRAFEIRSGGRVFRTAEAVDPQFKRTLELAYVNWRDPLNPEDFARWRDSQTGRTDRVTRDSGWVRLTTVVLGAGPVRSASITVAQPDWRPIARTVEFRDRESVEVREVIRPQAGSPAVASKAQPVEDAAEQAASTGDVSDLEIRLWEVLRRTDADVLDSGAVKRDSGGICYQVWPDEERREMVTRALTAVEGARPCAAVPESRTQPRVLPPLSADTGGAAPFAAALANRFGSREAAARYADQVLQQHIELLARISALERLLQRFTPQRFEALPEQHRLRVSAIAAQHAVAIQTRGASYLDLMSEGLRAASADAGRPDRLPPPDPGTCKVSPRRAGSLMSELKALQAQFNALFGGAEGGSAGTAPDVLLSNALKNHAAVASRLAALCADQ